MSAFSDRLERIAQNKQQPKSNFQKRLARVKNGQGIGAESEIPEFEYGLYTEEEGVLPDEQQTEERQFPEKIDQTTLPFEQPLYGLFQPEKLIPDSVRQRFPSGSPIDELFKGVPGGVKGAIGAADAVLGTVTQAPASLLGSMVGTVEGIADSVSDGTFGTQEGARNAFKTMQERTKKFSDTPLLGGSNVTTEAGNKLMENLGKVSDRYAPPLLSGGVAPLMTGVPSRITKNQETAERIKRGDEDEELATKRIPDPQSFDSGRPVVRDGEAAAVIKQGLEPKTVQMVKQASNADKQRMLEMVNLREKGLTNLKEENLNRAHDVAGKELQKNITKVVVAKRKAGEEVDRASKALRGVAIPNATIIGEKFVRSLKDALNVDLDPQTGTLNFSDSALNMTPDLQKVINKVINASRRDISDAYGLHNLKKGLDELINYEKEGQGLTGSTEVVLKRLRADIDGYLDGASGDYDTANQQFAALADAYGSIRKVTGNKADFDAAFADKQLGTLLRRLGGNQVSRSNLMDAISKLQLVGGIKDTDLMALVLFAEKLDDVLGSPSAMTSFKGDIQRAGSAVATNQSGAQVVMDLAQTAGDKIKGINDKNALKATRRLLLRDLNENKRRESQKSKLPVER